MAFFIHKKEKHIVELIEKHVEAVVETVHLVQQSLNALLDGDEERATSITKQVHRKEHEADTIKTEIRQRIPKTFYLPVYRGDLLAYLKLQDDIADSVEDVAVCLTIKNLVLPAALEELTFEYVERVLRTCELLFQCTDQLATLVEGDPASGRVEEILEVISQAEHEEWRADKAEFSLAQKLFALDDEMKATDIFLWSNIFRELGRLANHADKTAERLRRMLAR